MAYATARSSRRPPPRSGGGNVVGMAIAAVIVLGGIIAVIVMNSKKDPPEPKKAPPIVAAPTPAPAAVAKAPEYPPMPQAKVDEAKRLVASFATKAAEAKTLLEDSKKAKAAGNDAEWQSKLRDASRLATDINDAWGEFEAGLPTNKDYDQEAVSAHYFKRERGQVDGYVKDVKRSLKSDERIR